METQKATERAVQSAYEALLAKSKEDNEQKDKERKERTDKEKEELEEKMRKKEAIIENQNQDTQKLKDTLKDMMEAFSKREEDAAKERIQMREEREREKEENRKEKVAREEEMRKELEKIKKEIEKQNDVKKLGRNLSDPDKEMPASKRGAGSTSGTPRTAGSHA